MTVPNYTMRLPAELRRRLEEAARRDGLELSEWIRVALREALARSQVSDQPRAPSGSGTLYRQKLGKELVEALSKLGWRAPA